MLKKNGNHVFSTHLKEQNGILKRKNEKALAKKGKNKFSKISNDNLVESLKLFSSKDLKTEKKSKKPEPIIKTPIQITKHANRSQRKVQVTSKINSNFAKLSKNLSDECSSHVEKLHSDFDSYDKEVDQEMFDSRKEAANLFKKIISPVTNKQFFSKYWEKQAMLVRREQFNFYKSWFSCKVGYNF